MHECRPNLCRGWNLHRSVSHCSSSLHLLLAQLTRTPRRYTLASMPPGAAYAGAFFRAFLGVKGGLMATFYSAASDPTTGSLDAAPYSRAETRVVARDSAAFACSNCWAAARFHGFFKKAAGANPCGASGTAVTIDSGFSRTYFYGMNQANTWASAAAATPTLNCANGQYVEIFHETRKGQASSHAVNTLLLLDITANPFGGSGNLYAAYAISNTPVPLTVTA